MPIDIDTVPVDQAEAMERDADGVVRFAPGRRADPSGDVRIMASRVIATYLLPPVVAALAESGPAIRVDVVATDEISNLLRRDADIAPRMVRPSQPDLIASRIGMLRLGAYVASGYVERFGVPALEADGLMAHRLIAYDCSNLIRNGPRGAGVPMKREDFAARTDN